jgi:hypothetical protein
MLAEYGVGVVLSHTSLYQTLTVFVPSPGVNIQLIVVAKDVHEEQAAVLEMHICICGHAALAVRVRVTAVLLVQTAPPLISIEPVGGFVSAGTVAHANRFEKKK